jgi:hypothetical protein
MKKFISFSSICQTTMPDSNSDEIGQMVLLFWFEGFWDLCYLYKRMIRMIKNFTKYSINSLSFVSFAVRKDGFCIGY